MSSAQSSAASPLAEKADAPERVGPYTIYGRIGSGGMASVHLGKLRSASGFTRIVAIKRMHTELARTAEFIAMFFQEARLVGRIQHPNVVAALDCVAIDNNAMLVMEYVHGLSLNQLLRKRPDVPFAVVSSILVGSALGLHAAHEAVDDNGQNMGIVHRDVSPHNIMVGVDGVARVLDFGIAKAAEQISQTRTGEVKGKIAYMAPEQLLGEPIGREADVYSLGVVMWEMFAGRRFFANDIKAAAIMMRVAHSQFASPREVNPRITSEIEAVIMKALSRSPQDRYRSALEFAVAVEACCAPSSQRVVGQWVAATANDELMRRSAMLTQIDLSAPRFAGPSMEAAGSSETEDVATRFGLSRRARDPRLSAVVPVSWIRGWPSSRVLWGGGGIALAAMLGATMALRSTGPLPVARPLDLTHVEGAASAPPLEDPPARWQVDDVAGPAPAPAHVPTEARALPTGPPHEARAAAPAAAPARAPAPAPAAQRPRPVTLTAVPTASRPPASSLGLDFGAIGGRK
jgi:eukaryotic-like serine/threonine-protein kinase